MRQIVYSIALISFVAVGANAQQQETVEKKPAKIEAKAVEAKKAKTVKKAKITKVKAIRSKEAVRKEEAIKEDDK